ncbi:HNH endonuclease [Sinorhizobium meliloti]|uniref:HNH endonuclease n=1 Tax=Rhizobium meliloti TaxID=382 RepID=UPI000FD43FAD|nr:HNH endonuclease [Sinorhizobium meliloti]RVH03044.1 HNH endonuclease [Sinorhizobium meliloti]
MGLKRAGYHVYRSAQWQALRLEAKRRDDFKCTECGSRGRLEVHHVIPVRQAPERAYDLGNVTCLCPTCHTKQTNAERGIAPKPAREAWASLLQKEI